MHPGYISWGEFEDNQAKLLDNANGYVRTGAKVRLAKALPCCRVSSSVAFAVCA